MKEFITFAEEDKKRIKFDMCIRYKQNKLNEDRKRNRLKIRLPKILE